MRYRLQRHDGTDCSATMVPITVLRMVPIQRYRHLQQVYKKSWKTICSHALINDDNHLINNALYYECIIFMLS